MNPIIKVILTKDYQLDDIKTYTFNSIEEAWNWVHNYEEHLTEDEYGVHGLVRVYDKETNYPISTESFHLYPKEK